MKTDKLADNPLAPDLLRKMNAYWQAANYLSVGQIYLYDNPLFKEWLKLSSVKRLIRLSRLPVADSSAGVSANQPQPARHSLQGRGHDYHTVLYAFAKRSRPLSSSLGCY